MTTFEKPAIDLNPNDSIMVLDSPVLIPAKTASAIPTPGSGIVLSEDAVTAGKLNLKSSAGTISVSATGVAIPTATAAGADLTVAAQNAGGSNKNGGSLILSSGAKSGSGANGSVATQIAGTTVTTTTANAITFTSTVTSPRIAQAAAAADTAGQTLIIAAQDGTKDKSDVAGGELLLSSGAAGGSGAVGSVQIACGGTTELAITDTIILATPPTFEFAATTASPTITQVAAAKDTAGQTLTIRAQAGGAKDKTADGAGGAVTIATGAGGGTADPGTLTLKVNTTTVFSANKTGIGFFAGAPAAKPAVSGAKADAVAASILAGLVSLGLVTDSTT